MGDLRLSKLAPKTNQFQKKDEFELNDFTVVAFEIGYGLAVSLFVFPYIWAIRSTACFVYRI